MRAVKGHLNDVVRFSVVDGPGKRFVLLLQGCNFNCITCRSPYTIGECDSCGECVEPCPEMALWFDGNKHVVVDEDLCTECDVCIEVCPIESTPLSKTVALDDLLHQIRAVAPFISGITISGGEPTLQADFVASLFCAIKCSDDLGRLTTFIDSNGYSDRETWDRLLPVMDGAMIDLKALDSATHLEMTGVDNAPVLDTIRYLSDWKRLYEVRLLMVPGHNDDPGTVRATGEWLHNIDPHMRVKLIGFRRNGVRPEYSDIPDADPEHIAKLAAIIRATGLTDLAVV